jgi:VIT1/CCC1 family predicted Fe2+/Mn2+ transporter
MYLAGEFDSARLAESVRAAHDEGGAVRLVASLFDEFLEPVTEESDRTLLYSKIAGSVREKEHSATGLTREDVYGAIASFFLVLFSCIPAALPFLFIDDSWVALRFSNAILIGLLFVVGYRWARHTNLPPVRVGLALLVGGLALVAVAIGLGG